MFSRRARLSNNYGESVRPDSNDDGIHTRNNSNSATQKDAVADLIDKTMDLDRHLEKQKSRRSRSLETRIKGQRSRRASSLRARINRDGNNSSVSNHVDSRRGGDDDEEEEGQEESTMVDGSSRQPMSALDRFKANRKHDSSSSPSKRNMMFDSSSVTPFTNRMRNSPGNSGPTSPERAVSEAGANYRNVGSMLDRFMGKSKLQQAAYGGTMADGTDFSFDTKGSDGAQFPTMVEKTTAFPSASKKSSSKTKSHRLGSVFQSWPYDNYRTDYDELLTIDSEPATGYDEDSVDGNRKNKEDILNEPPNEELPSINFAARNLPLDKFEDEAKKRAIIIISKWIYDTGLIDEILVHSTVPSIIDDSDYDYVASDKSVKTHEGFEFRTSSSKLTSGYLKMEREIDHLRRTTKQHLNMINARLADGVKSSGTEVHELVQSVEKTKGDIDQLKKTFTYISQKGDAKTGGYLLAGYDTMRDAINARKNLARCFTDLQNFANISTSCTKMHDSLSRAEYQRNEFIVLRDVATEYIALESMLLEAEAGLKESFGADADMEKVLSRSQGKRRQKLNDIDDYLATPRRNVMSLGIEIKGKILPGFNDAFELAETNPAALVALVEAVERHVYTAEEYKPQEQKNNRCTDIIKRFSTMRDESKSILYRSFLERCHKIIAGKQRLVSLFVCRLELVLT